MWGTVHCADCDWEYTLAAEPDMSGVLWLLQAHHWEYHGGCPPKGLCCG